MKLFFLSLGSNIGERINYINNAIALIQETIGNIAATSSLYETAAIGYESDSLFINAVVAVHSNMSAHEMLDATHKIETELGCYTHRNADGSYCDRTIDIDIVACDDMVCNDARLVIPHPRMHLRRFVLDPLCEIAPNWRHPLLNRTACELRNELMNKSH